MARAFSHSSLDGGGAAAVVVKSGLYRDTPSLYTCPRRPIVLLFPRSTALAPPSGSRRCNFHHPEHPSLPSPSSQVSPLQLGPRRVYFAVTLCSLIPRYRGDFQPLPPILSAGDWRLIDYDQGSSSRPNSGSKLGKVGMRGGGRDSGSNLLREQKPLSK